MKKMLMMMLMSLLLFAQCKKEEIIDDEIIENKEESRKIPVTCEISLTDDGTRSSFADLFKGRISWGSKQENEYIYLSVGVTDKYYSEKYKDTISVGELFELRAYVPLDAPLDKVMFKGAIEEKYLRNMEDECKLFYFGMEGNGVNDGFVENIYDPECGKLIGKRIDYSNQLCDMTLLGYYHIASSSAHVSMHVGDYDVIEEFVLFPDDRVFYNNMAIAMLDLKGEKILGGSATQLQSYTVKWDGRNHKLVESYDYKQDGFYEIDQRHGTKSFVALFPTDRKVDIRCSKGVYVFEDGIKSNHFYVGKAGNSAEDSRPLPWTPVEP